MINARIDRTVRAIVRVCYFFRGCYKNTYQEVFNANALWVFNCALYFERGSVPFLVVLHVNLALPCGQVQLIDVSDNLLVTSLDVITERHQR